VADDADHVRSWFVYVVKLPEGADRDGVASRLGERGVASAPYLPSIHLQSYMRERYGFTEGMLPVSEDCSSRTLALPFHARLEPVDQERVVEALRASL
jgi:perosamine synthetase